MAITAQSIILRATQVLQDTTSVRWTARELTRWLNDGQREVVIYRPDSNTVVATGTLSTARGTRQTLTGMTGVTNPARLIDIVRNMAGTSNLKAVRLIAREVLDAQVPDWHTSTPSVSILHYMHDPRDPLAFYVYPAPTGAAQLEIVYSAYPTDIALPAEGVTLESALPDTDTSMVAGTISLPDTFSNALLDYVLYRAYMKDSDYAGNVSRAAAHYTAFANSLGVDAKSLLAVTPAANAAHNPNSPVSA